MLLEAIKFSSKFPIEKVKRNPGHAGDYWKTVILLVCSRWSQIRLISLICFQFTNLLLVVFGRTEASIVSWHSKPSYNQKQKH